MKNKKRKQNLKKLKKIHASLVDFAKYYWDTGDIKTAMQIDRAVAAVNQSINIHNLVDRIKKHEHKV